VNPIVATVEACQTASEVFDALNRFFAWSHRTRPDFVAYGPVRIESTRDIVTWKAGLRSVAKRRQQVGKSVEDLSYIADVLEAAWRRLEELGRS
jgi:hypothetical protein